MSTFINFLTQNANRIHIIISITLFRPFGFLVPKDLYINWLSKLMTLILLMKVIPDTRHAQ